MTTEKHLEEAIDAIKKLMTARPADQLVDSNGHFALYHLDRALQQLPTQKDTQPGG